MPDPNIPEISILITVPIFSMFSTDWSAKVHAGEAPPKNKS